MIDSNLRQRRKDNDSVDNVNYEKNNAETESKTMDVFGTTAKNERKGANGDWVSIFRTLRPAWTASDRVTAWEASLVTPDGLVIPAGQARPMNAKTFRLALSVAPGTFIELIKLFWKVGGLRLVIFLMGNVINGLIPAWHAVTMANLLDCVQTVLSTGSVDQPHILRLAGVNLLAAQSERLLELLMSNNDRIVRNQIDESIEYLYLRSQLTLEIPTLSNPRVANLITEAGAFAGFETFTDSKGGMWSQSPSRQLNALTSIIRAVFTLLSGSSVMLSTIIGATRGSISWSATLFIFLSFLPSLLGLFNMGERFWGHWLKSPMTKREIHELGRNGMYKQEILLFGLADWVMEKWKQAHDMSIQERDAFRQSNTALGIDMIKDSIETLSYTCIALGIFPATVSIGNMRLCQSCADSLVRTVKSLREKLESIVSYTFCGTAFLESLRLQETILHQEHDLVEYKPVDWPNGRKGMKIEARNLSFTYPGQTTPTLKNVNIVIEPGETLAIVGFNGGGKTTLIKVLMGLFGCEGTLLINDQPASTYSRASLHAHTTVCFQDYAKYNLTLKENVGTGNYSRMEDRDLMHDALSKAGADAVVSKLPKGINEELEKFWTPPLGEDVGALPSLAAPPFPLPGPPPPGLGPPPPPPSAGPPAMTKMAAISGGRKGRRMMRMNAREAKGLSGGQWQRVALARAFMRSDEADLVVFDEPSASLDARAEHELFERIHALSLSPTGEKIRTTVYVSHRFSTTRRADKIAVVEEGTITELGSHEQLMQFGGRYAEFFNLQAKAFLD